MSQIVDSRPSQGFDYARQTLLGRTAELADAYVASLPTRPVRAQQDYATVLTGLDGPLPEHGRPDAQVVEELVAAAEPGIVATAGPRYFGFVIGGALPAALAADWLVATWDGPQASAVTSPAAQAIEEVTARWVLELLGLPDGAAVGFVTGGSMANFVGAAAARHHVLARAGWDVEEDGLSGAPAVRVLVGEDCHHTVVKAIRMLGLGSRRIVPVAADANGAMRPDRLAQALRAGDGPAIVCAQAGSLNTGACDPLGTIADVAHEHGAWVHVDGAFGLWAAASPRFRGLLDGAERCDSWAVDAHKWLNTPYDCGIAIVADPAALVAAMSATADYLPGTGIGDGFHRTPELSRRGRQVPVYAALRSLGRAGVAELVDRCCDHATRLAGAMASEPGCAVLNDVVLNQVLLRFGDDDATTAAVVDHVQRDGAAWLGGTVWRGRFAARVSVINWSTTAQDIDRLAEALRRAHAAVTRA